jgi:hypothetical protein
VLVWAGDRSPASVEDRATAPAAAGAAATGAGSEEAAADWVAL